MGRALPVALLAEVDAFKTSMASAQLIAAEDGCDPDPAWEWVEAACGRMHDALCTYIAEFPDTADAIGAYVFRETFAHFMSSRFLDRCMTKPRAFTGDYGTIDLIYDAEPAGDGRLGSMVDRWALELPVCRAIRNRRSMTAAYLHEALAAWQPVSPMPVVSLGCGSAREVFDLFASAPSYLGPLVTCVDRDSDALNHVGALANAQWLGGRLRLLHADVVRLAAGGGGVSIAPQQLVYCAGLIEYLPDDQVIAILNWAYETLRLGGSVILGSLVPDNPNKPFLDWIVEWDLVHRSPEELEELFRRSRFADAAVTVALDDTGIQAFVAAVRT